MLSGFRPAVGGPFYDAPRGYRRRGRRSTDGGPLLDLAARRALEGDLVSAVQDAVADGVGDGRVWRGVVPAFGSSWLVITVARKP